MKELELTFTLRNNRLKERRAALGMTRRALAQAVGVEPAVYGALEALKRSPYCKSGAWTVAATRLATYFRTVEEELFPAGVLHVKKHEVVRTIDEADIGNLLTDHQQQMRLLPDAQLEEVEMKEDVHKALETLSNREEKILRMRFGIGEKDGDHTLEEVAKDFEVSRDRIRQIEARALRKLHHPSRSKQLRQYVQPSKDDE
jgi:RNA polymerase sigma factor (sigma-70 family)